MVAKLVSSGGKTVGEPPGTPQASSVHIPLEGLRIQVTREKLYISVADKEGPRAIQGLEAIGLLHERMTQHGLAHAVFERDSPGSDAKTGRCKVPDTIIIG